VLFCPGIATAASGDLDPTFGTGGKVTTDFAGSNAGANGVALQADGKIVAAGFADSGSGSDFALARYNPDGSLDASFGTGGKVTTDFAGGSDSAFGVALQADGKIVAAGFADSGSRGDFALARYNPDGSLDASFGTGGKVTTDFAGSGDEAFGVALQADGKIVAAGFAGSGSRGDFALARYQDGVAKHPSLAISKSHRGDFTQGKEGTYTITVGNEGTGATDGTTVSVHDTLPTGLTASSISGSGWTCTLATLTCTRSDALAAGNSYPPITLTVNVAANAPAQVTNTSTVTGGGDSTTHTATDPTTIAPAPRPSLTIGKNHRGNFTQGRTGTYTMTVGNSGPGATDGTTVNVHDTLPTGLTASSISGSGWTCTLATLTCTRSDALAAGNSYPPITLTVNVSCRTQHKDTDTATGGRERQVTNTATVSGGGDTTTHTATDTATIKNNKHCGKGKEEGKKPGKKNDHRSFYEYGAADRSRS
jgi:uncharacterized delta-60 repeat protein/uncharacterized repeat protein (TIGR01451 family)